MKVLDKDLWIDNSSSVFQRIVSAEKSKCGVWWLDSAKVILMMMITIILYMINNLSNCNKIIITIAMS